MCFICHHRVFRTNMDRLYLSYIAPVRGVTVLNRKCESVFAPRDALRNDIVLQAHSLCLLRFLYLITTSIPPLLLCVSPFFTSSFGRHSHFIMAHASLLLPTSSKLCAICH